MNHVIFHYFYTYLPCPLFTKKKEIAPNLHQITPKILSKIALGAFWCRKKKKSISKKNTLFFQKIFLIFGRFYWLLINITRRNEKLSKNWDWEAKIPTCSTG